MIETSMLQPRAYTQLRKIGIWLVVMKDRFYTISNGKGGRPNICNFRVFHLSAKDDRWKSKVGREATKFAPVRLMQSLLIRMCQILTRR